MRAESQPEEFDMRIAMFLRAGRQTHSVSIAAEIIRRLSDRGVAVEVIAPEERRTDLTRLRVEHDLYILKYRSDLTLSLAGALHALGARIVNPYPVSEMLRDKIVAAQMLEAANIPAPESYVASRPEQLVDLLDEGPLIVKPCRGSRGRGVHVIRMQDQLSTIPLDRSPVLAQRYKEPEGRDRKIYCIGERVFGVKRVWPAQTYEQKLGEPFEVVDDLLDIVMRCRRTFGIDVFGIDVVISHGRPYVVDTSAFPGFKGVPEAGRHLADYIYDACAEAKSGQGYGHAARDRGERA